MSSIITAIGTANPQYRFSQMKIFEFMKSAHQLNHTDAGRLQKLYETSGIAYRHSVIEDFGVPQGTYSFFGNEACLEPFPDTRQRSAFYEKWAKELSLSAIRDLEQHFTVDLQSITHLITVSCTGMYAPGLDIDIVRLLQLPPTIERTCINFMGCYGAFNALKSAYYICAAQPHAKVLIVDTELCTLHFQRENTVENWISNALFADGAAAVLVESTTHSSKGFHLKTYYNTLIPEAADEMGWRIGNHGFEMKLASSIARNIGKKIKGIAEQLVHKANSSQEHIQHVAIHPGGRRILEACEEMLELPEEALTISYDVLRQYGNMSSATILFILKAFFSKTQSGEQLMSFAFGPGLTVESMILERK